MGAQPGNLRVGTSGWQYDHWKGIFYPEGVAKRRWFEHFARTFDTVEINNTFYRLPGEKAFDTWRAQAPEHFLYALKFSRFGTHVKRLLDPENSIGHFVPLAERLGGHLGPILVQLPPHFKVDPQRLDHFLTVAPRQHRWTVEIRDPSWFTEEVYGVLGRHRAALCYHDKLVPHPRPITADFIYQRFHGGEQDGNYSDAALQREAHQLREYLEQGLDVYAYFNNDMWGHALHNALDLRRLIAGS